MDDLPVRDEQAGPLVESVDGEVFLQAQARKTSQRSTRRGVLCLPALARAADTQQPTHPLAHPRALQCFTPALQRCLGCGR